MSTRHPIKHFCCQNKMCPDYGLRDNENLVFRGWSGKGKRIRMIYCRACKACFSEHKGAVLEESCLSEKQALAVLEHLREGNGTRATSRLTGVTANAVTRYLRLAGPHSRRLHNELVAFSPSHQRSANG